MDLAAFGLAPELLSEWSGRFSGGLSGAQLEAVNERRVLDGRVVPELPILSVLTQRRRQVA